MLLFSLACMRQFLILCMLVTLQGIQLLTILSFYVQTIAGLTAIAGLILCQELARAVRTYVFGDNDNIKGRQHQKHVDVTQPNPTVTAVLCNQTFNANKEAPDTEGYCLKRLLCLLQYHQLQQNNHCMIYFIGSITIVNFSFPCVIILMLAHTIKRMKTDSYFRVILLLCTYLLAFN